MKKIIKNIKAKQTIIGIGVIFLIILAFISGFFIMTTPIVKAVESSDFAYSKKITIESDFIDETLINFPVLVHDDTGDLQGKILSNGSDIAFFDSTNTTQFNHEVELYNSSNGELVAWVNITSIDSSIDTVFYMCYNDTINTYPVGYNPSGVWDSDYEVVYHMNDLPNASAVNDSTSNNNDGNKKSVNHPVQSDGKIGKCQDFDGSQDWIKIASNPDIDTCSFTLIMWLRNPDSSTAYQKIFSRGSETVGGTDKYGTEFTFSDLGNPCCYLRKTGDSNDYCAYDNISFGKTWAMMTFVFNKTTGHYLAFHNGTIEEDKYQTSSNIAYHNRDNGTFLGVHKLTDLERHWFTGMMDEVRISSINRSNAWLKATFHSTNETIGFLTLGTEKIKESSYSLKGLSSPYGITWSGNAGDSVWCNSSGDAYEYMEINMFINSSDNVTGILVWVDDLNNTGEYINASNITIYVSSDNSSYGELGTFDDGGSNLSINTSTWNEGTMGSNPFAGAGLTSKTVSIWCVFKLAIPADISSDTFTSATPTSWKVRPGHYE